MEWWLLEEMLGFRLLMCVIVMICIGDQNGIHAMR